MLQPFIRTLQLQNLLSFGDVPSSLELRNLNVLVGPNGSGKSNLIEALSLLKNAPKDLAVALSKGGPVDEWLWKGATATPTASLEAIVAPANPDRSLRYRLAFTKVGSRFEITEERLERRLQ